MRRKKAAKSAKPIVKSSSRINKFDFSAYFHEVEKMNSNKKSIFKMLPFIFVIAVIFLPNIIYMFFPGLEPANFKYSPVKNSMSRFDNQVRADSPSASFVYKMETGDFLESNFDGNTFKAEKRNDAVVNLRNMQVSESGEITAELTADNIESVLTVNGVKRFLPPLARPESQDPLILKISPKGQILESRGGAVEKSLQPLFLPVILPDGTKKAGDSWETLVQQEFEMFPQAEEAEGGLKLRIYVTIKSHFVSYDRKTGCAVVSEEFHVTRVSGIRKFFEERLGSKDFKIEGYKVADTNDYDLGKGTYSYEYKSGVISKLRRRLNMELQTGEFYMVFKKTTELELLSRKFAD